MYYNIFRWYRSGWGRYSQADPIGLSGGISLYGYVDGQPTVAADPYGLIKIERKISYERHLFSTGGRTWAYPLNINFECTCSSDEKFKLQFVVYQYYLEAVSTPGSRIHEDLHVDMDWSRKLSILGELLPAEHEIYPSKGACESRARQELARIRPRFFEFDWRHVSHDLKDLFFRWN